MQLGESLKKQYTSFETKQHEIISLLLKFRHLSQPQIQQLLNQKAKERIRTTLNQLTESGYIIRNFELEIARTPAQYSLGIKGIGYLRDQNIDPKLLKRLYNERTHTEAYKERSLFIADIYLSLKKLIAGTNAVFYFKTKTEMYNLRYLILPHPDAYIYIHYPEEDIKHYFLDVFDDRTIIKKRVYQYLKYYKKQYWQSKTKTEFPEILFIYPDEPTKKYMYRYIQKIASNNSPSFYLTTKEQIKNLGLCKEVLEKVEL